MLFCVSLAHAAPLRVTIVLSEEGGAYQAFNQSLLGMLPVNRFKLSAQWADDPLLASDLYIAVGMKAAARLSSVEVPTLDVLIPKASYEKLHRGNGPRASQRSAVFLDQPLERQLALLQSVLPDIRNVGVLYASPPPELQSLRRQLAEKNIRLNERAVNASQSLNDALESVLGVSEALFVLPDADVYNPSTIRNILLTAYRKKIPLVGISQAYVKAGALCAVYTTPEQVAGQTAAMIQRYAESGKLPLPQYPSSFEVSVNTQVARSLDLNIKDADRLRDKIGRAP